MEVVALMKDGATYKVQLSPLGTTPADLLSLAPDPDLPRAAPGAKDLTGGEVTFGTWTLKLQADGAADFKSLPPDAIAGVVPDRQLHDRLTMLTPSEIEALVGRIVARIQPERIIVFGSYAKGKAHPGSDLDLCIVTDTHLPRARRADNLGPLLATCLVPVDVHVHTPEEVQVYGAEEYSFLWSVLQAGRVVYAAGE